MNSSYENWKRARRNRVVMIILGTLVVMALAVMFFIGLQGRNALEGSWYLTTMNGQPLADNRLYVQLMFQWDGQGTLTWIRRGDEESSRDETDFTWHADGDRLSLGSSLFFPGTDRTFSLNKDEAHLWNITGNSLAIDTENGTLIFQRE